MRLLISAVLLLPIGTAVYGADQSMSLDDRLAFVKNSINTNASTEIHLPPRVDTKTSWQMGGTGCQLEVKETFHRESRGAIVNAEGPVNVFEDTVKTYTFNLGGFTNKYVRGVTAEAIPFIILTSGTDLYALHTAFTSKTLKGGGPKAGEEISTHTSDTEGRARTLSIYFNAGKTDNTKLVRALQKALRASVTDCKKLHPAASASD